MFSLSDFCIKPPLTGCKPQNMLHIIFYWVTTCCFSAPQKGLWSQTFEWESHVQEHEAINMRDKNDQDPCWHYLPDVIKPKNTARHRDKGEGKSVEQICHQCQPPLSQPKAAETRCTKTDKLHCTGWTAFRQHMCACCLFKHSDTR